MSDIRCAGCGTYLGAVQRDPETRIWCNNFCLLLPSADGNESRDSLITALVENDWVSRAQIAEEFGVSRQRVSQIVDDRSTA